MGNTHVATIHDINGTVHIGDPFELKDSVAVQQWVQKTTDALGKELETLKLERSDLVVIIRSEHVVGVTLEKIS